MSTQQVKLANPSGRCYQLRYTIGKKKIRKSTGTMDAELAEEMRAELEAKLVLGISTRRERVTGPEMDWDDFRYEYAKHLEAEQLVSRHEIAAKLDIAEAIVKPITLADMAKHDALTDLQHQLLRGAKSRFKRPRSPATAEGYLRVVRAALSFACTNGWLTAVPKIKPLKVDKHMKGRPLIGEEFDRMLAKVPAVVGKDSAESWRFLMRGVVTSGLRLGEIMNMSWDIPETIQPVMQRGRLPVIRFLCYTQKNGKTEEIPLNAWFEALLNEIPHDDRIGWIFNPTSIKSVREPQESRLAEDWVGKVVSRIGKKAGVVVAEANPRTRTKQKYASVHDLRRTFAVRLKQSSMPPHLIQQLMRHSNIETTKNYYLTETVQHDAAQIQSILSVPKNSGYTANEKGLTV